MAITRDHYPGRRVGSAMRRSLWCWIGNGRWGGVTYRTCARRWRTGPAAKPRQPERAPLDSRRASRHRLDARGGLADLETEHWAGCAGHGRRARIATWPVASLG